MKASITERGLATIAIRREVPCRPGWTQDKTCRVLAGCYQTAVPFAREVYLAEQIGAIQGWSGNADDGWVTLFVAVRVSP